MANFAQVVVDIKNDFCSETYDYLIPSSMQEFVDVGSRVLVPFGKQEVLAYVLSLSDSSDYAKDAKEIKEVLDYDQELTQKQIELAKFISDTYYVNMVSVLELMIPSFLKGQKRKYIEVRDYDLLPPSLALLFDGKKRFPINKKIEDVYDDIRKEIRKGNISLNYYLYTFL